MTKPSDYIPAGTPLYWDPVGQWIVVELPDGTLHKIDVVDVVSGRAIIRTAAPGDDAGDADEPAVVEARP